MTNSQIETMLLTGLPIKMNDKFQFKPPILKDIFNITFEELMGGVNCVYDLNYALYKNKEIYKIIEDNNFNSFDSWKFIFLLEKEGKNSILSTLLIDCLKNHLNQKISINDECEIVVGDSIFNQDDYNLFCRILKITYGLEERIEDRKFADNITKRKAIEMKLARSEIDKIENKNNSFLYQIISVLRIKKSNEEINNSNLFQLIDLYKRFNKEKDYDALMSGIYTGNVDVKKIDLDKKHWTAKVD